MHLTPIGNWVSWSIFLGVGAYWVICKILDRARRKRRPSEPEKEEEPSRCDSLSALDPLSLKLRYDRCELDLNHAGPHGVHLDSRRERWWPNSPEASASALLRYARSEILGLEIDSTPAARERVYLLYALTCTLLRDLGQPCEVTGVLSPEDLLGEVRTNLFVALKHVWQPKCWNDIHTRSGQILCIAHELRAKHHQPPSPRIQSDPDV